MSLWLLLFAAAAAVPPAAAAEFELSDEVRDVLTPLFDAIKNAEVSRATVDMLSDALINGRVVESERSTYQIASKRPDKFTVYLKQPARRTRVYNDGRSLVVALSPRDYFRLNEPLTIEQAVWQQPVPMGPYPEPLLALTLAGVDPAGTLVDNMASVELVGEKDFRGTVPSIQLHGVQTDQVSWDLWITRGANPQPLRLLVDLTGMLMASPDLGLPAGYSHQVRYDFLSYRLTGQVSDQLFAFSPAAGATQYKSLEDYLQSQQLRSPQHPLLGQPLPAFHAETLAGGELASADLKGQVVVLDFWASWHPPCATILPLLSQITAQYADKQVQLLAVNVGEPREKVEAFFAAREMALTVLLDPEARLAKSLSIETLPQTMVIGRDGVVESVHVGFSGEDELRRRLTDELDVLVIGGQIASATSGADP